MSDVYVYKAKPEPDGTDDVESNDGDPKTYAEHASVCGYGVTRSELLNGFLDEEDYYIAKVSWTAKEIMGGDGYSIYDIGAIFANIKDSLS